MSKNLAELYILEISAPNKISKQFSNYISKNKYLRLPSNPFRKITACLRSKPDCIIAGAQRSGTTSLFHTIKQHPEIGYGQRKELHYFTLHYDNNINEYRSCFPLNTDNNIKIFMESTPDYMIYSNIPKRIKNNLGEIKIIFMLRNPIDRAVSGYWHSVRFFQQNNSLENHIKKEFTFISKSFENSYKFSIIYRGFYAKFIKYWLKHFSRESIKIIFYENLVKNPQKELSKIYSFLKIEDSKLTQPFPENNRQSYPEVKNYMREWIKRIYQKDYTKLKEIIDPIPWQEFH